MKSKARPQGQEVSEQREGKMKREKKKKRNKEKSPAAGRFHNILIHRYLKNYCLGSRRGSTRDDINLDPPEENLKPGRSF